MKSNSISVCIYAESEAKVTVNKVSSNAKKLRHIKLCRSFFSLYIMILKAAPISAAIPRGIFSAPR
jgi:hypothetical protein